MSVSSGPIRRSSGGDRHASLSAAWAPRRVSVRWDNDPYLFPDPFQGWPAGANGYTDLIDGLLANDSTTLRTGVDVSLANLDKHMREAAADLVVLTCPLDVFCDFRQGEVNGAEFSFVTFTSRMSTTPRVRWW